MANIIYNRAKKEIADGTIDLVVDDIQVMLVTSTYVPNADHDFIDAGGASDPVDAELAGTGYTRKSLTTKAIAEDDVNDRAEYDADDVTWTAINAGTADALIVFKNTGVDTTSVLIAFIDSGFPVTTNGGDLTVQWNAEGILQFA